jgi:predicted nucleic acid-binding protein
VSKAKKISPDIDDIDFFALALKLGCGIWSNEERLKRQSAVKVLTTEELLKSLRL